MIALQRLPQGKGGLSLIESSSQYWKYIYIGVSNGY